MSIESVLVVVVVVAPSPSPSPSPSPPVCASPDSELEELFIPFSLFKNISL